MVLDALKAILLKSMILFDVLCCFMLWAEAVIIFNFGLFVSVTNTTFLLPLFPM